MPSRLMNIFSSSSNPKEEKGRLYYGWIVLVACFIIGVICWGIQNTFGVFFKSLETGFDWTRTLTSGIFSVFMLLCPVFAIFGGWAIDRYGSRIVVTMMGFLIGLSLLLTSLANTWWHFFISYSLLLAAGTGATFTIISSVASRWFIKRRGLAVGIVSSGIGVGTMIMPPIAAYLISIYDWRMSYCILGLVGFFVITPFAFLLKGAPGKEAASPESERLEAIHLPSAEGQAVSETRGFSFLQAARTKNFWLIFSIWFLGASCIRAMEIHIVPHAIDLDITPIRAATILSLLGGMNIPGRILVGRVSDSIGRKQAIMICTLLMAGAMLWLIWASGLWELYLFAVIFGFFAGGANTPIAALIGDTYGLRHLGIITGVLVAGFGLGAAFGSALAGYIFDVKGSYVFAFIAGLVAALVATGLALFLTAPKGKKE